MSKHIDDVLDVLTRLVRSSHGDSVSEVRAARIATAPAVAADRKVTFQTNTDAYGRRLQPEIANIHAFDLAVAEWLQGDASRLQEAIVNHCHNDRDFDAVLSFFSLEPDATPVAVDSTDSTGPERVQVNTYHILRDTAIARQVKKEEKCRCQLCQTTLSLVGRLYAEAHHIKPLGKPHHGPDARENILCVCPTCHVKLDYGAICLTPDGISTVSQDYVTYHNKKIAIDRAV